MARENWGSLSNPAHLTSLAELLLLMNHKRYCKRTVSRLDDKAEQADFFNVCTDLFNCTPVGRASDLMMALA